MISGQPVGKVSEHRPEWQGSDSREGGREGGKEFYHNDLLSGSEVSPMDHGFFAGGKAGLLKTDHLLPYSAEIKNVWNFTSTHYTPSWIHVSFNEPLTHCYRKRKEQQAARNRVLINPLNNYQCISVHPRSPYWTDKWQQHVLLEKEVTAFSLLFSDVLYVIFQAQLQFRG
jgi:hypothetical protein